MQLDPHGAQLFAAALSPAEAAALVAHFRNESGNTRLAPGADLVGLIAPADALASSLLGPCARAVRAVFFDKTPAHNWSLGWHQDRTVAVRERREVPGFADWTVKSGIAHCVPPFDYLARMLTFRIHLDDVGETNAPLLVSPGTHLRLIAEPDIPAEVERHGRFACLAKTGDIWAYSTPILHASGRAGAPGRRRVLQLLYTADDLPAGLSWLGI